MCFGLAYRKKYAKASLRAERLERWKWLKCRIFNEDRKINMLSAIRINPKCAGGSNPALEEEEAVVVGEAPGRDGLQVDLVIIAAILLGVSDDIAHVNDEHLSTDKVLMVMQNLTDLLRHTFSSQFVFPVLGNHDFYPQNQLPPRRHPTYKKVADMWRHWLPTEAIDSFEKGGYYTIEQKVRRLRLVALNTNLYYRANRQTGGGGIAGGHGERRGLGNGGNGFGSGNIAMGTVDEEEDDPAGQWRWLEGVYLVGHVPPGVDERRPNSMNSGAFKERFNKKYLHLVRNSSDITTRIPSESSTMREEMTPWRTPSGANNPGLRLYKFDTDTGQVLDYVQYFLNLSSANHRDHAEWQVEYNLTSLYGLPNVSAASLHELAETFRSGPTVDNSASFYGGYGYSNGGGWGSSAVPLPVVSPMLGVDLFERYYRANSVGYHHGIGWGSCNAACRRGHYCSITRVDYQAFRECMEADLGDGNSGVGKPYSLLGMLCISAALIFGR
ncbi:hypothetical protein J437_LFUL015081 [Ladona fulva]|uniref:Sphingomyelin phosphodiesterase C-terminal domain-containing protein n=1 Tax=Ladona fulva TaxID=123851 RepID=A0A8K0KJS4_LADFU|nr:hypothetical protein J437_LFUL015081 [Ladona fulva]